MPLRAADARRTVTPNATMTTLASPTQGGSATSLWRVDMAAGARGPEHVFDVEQLWTVLSGRVAFDVDGAEVTLDPGDTIVLPAGAARRVSCEADAVLYVCGAGAGVVRVVGEAAPRGTPAWIA
ncbi:MAG: cupin domain-containing protein [Myxococcota bacterium]